MSDHNERACTECGSLLHHESRCALRTARLERNHMTPNPDQSRPAPQEAGERVRPPKGYRIVSGEELRETGAGKNMRAKHKGADHASWWETSYSTGQTMDERDLRDFRYAIPLEPGQEVSTDAAQPTDGEILDWLEKTNNTDIIHEIGQPWVILPPNNKELGRGPTLREAAINAMKAQPK